MKQPIDVLDLLATHREIIDRGLEHFLREQRAYDMYQHMLYFLGFVDEHFVASASFGGKRFRSCLSLLLADSYGDKEKAMPAALSIELFHNFTLIHDDIVDRDVMRRGRPTVWKLWGVDQAINSGDAQHILSNLVLARGIQHNPVQGAEIQIFLNERYLEILEGQYLDFTLTEHNLDDREITQEAYMEMIEKKTAVLIGAATAVGGMAHGVDKGEVNVLYAYGFNLGVAYQICDDMHSIWSSTETTGKTEGNDILARKKTLPILHMLRNLNPKDRKNLCSMYNSTHELNDSDVAVVISYLESTNTYTYMKSVLDEYAKKSLNSLQKLSLEPRQKQKLATLNQALLSI